MSHNFWDEKHEKAFIERVGIGYTLVKKNPATIDAQNYRHVFCVQNNRGIRRYFDKQGDAVALVRESKFQPCKIIQIPILPCGEYHSMPIDDIAKLIEGELKK